MATRWSNRAVLRLVLLVMGLMALIGLSYALWTKEFRNRNDQRRLIVKANKNIEDGAPGLNPVAPAELRALGYLPADTNVVGALHVAEMLREPIGRRFLEHPRPFPIGEALAGMEDWTGLKLEAVDHVVFGTKIGAELPQVYLVLQTRQPYTVSEVGRAKALHGSRPGKYRDKPLYHGRINPVGDLLVWCADERTLVVLYRLEATREGDLDTVPDKPRRGDDGLPPPLKSCLEKRLSKGTLVWLAGHLDQPDILEPLLMLAPVPADVQKLVPTVQTFAAGLCFQNGVTLLADFHCTSDLSARELTQYLRRASEGFGIAKVVSSPSRRDDSAVMATGAVAGGTMSGAGTLSAAAALAAGASAAGRFGPDAEADWVTLQVRAEPDAMRDMLNGVGALLPTGLRRQAGSR